jgi:oligopeptide transport system substrate-binding protein
MKSKTLLILFSLLAITGLFLVACQPQTVETVRTVVVTEVVEVEGETVVVTEIVEVPVTMEPAPEEEQPVTLSYNLATEPPNIDPGLATDTTSVTVAGNMFQSLTFQDPETFEITPGLATSWEAGTDADGNQTWTFHMRDDVPWVNYDPLTGETTQEVDDEGNPRFVNANDVVYAVKRVLDPNTASDYAYILYIIQNAQEVNTGAEGVTLDDVGVVALDDQTVQFTLNSPAGFFPAIASTWTTAPVPQWVIESDLGDRWTEAGVIVTNGPYVLDTWIHGGEMVLVKNPLYPEADSVQIERIEGVMITDSATAFALYENNELDSAAVPLPEMDRVKADPTLSTEFTSVPVNCTYYYGFTNNKPPFDDARVRRAFSAAIDRQSLIDNVLKGGQTPAPFFTNPVNFGAPTVDSGVGLGYDPELAQATLQEYLDESGMTIDDFNALGIVLMHNTSDAHAQIAAAIQQMWADTLGAQVTVENQEFGVYLDTLNKETPLADVPHIWRLGWCADYPDANNWLNEVFSIYGANNTRRNCVDENCAEMVPSRYDDLVLQAMESQDPEERLALYAEAEEILADEEAAVANIYFYTTANVSKPWLTRTFASHDYFPSWSIDMAAKQAALGE